jgi:hypothetical protein
MHSVGLEPTTSPSTLLQREEVPFELKFIGEPQNEKYHITYFQLKQMCKRRKFDLNINCKNNNEKIKKEKKKKMQRVRGHDSLAHLCRVLGSFLQIKVKGVSN